MTKNIRSASERWAIERIDSRGLPFAGVEQAADVERLALHPGGEPGRGEQVVELHRQGEPVLGGEEGLQVDHADLVERRRLDGVDEARHVEVAARPPGVVEDVGQQDVLAAGDRVGLDAQEGQQPRDRRGDALAIGLRLADQRRRRGRERAEDRQRQPGAATRACRSPGRRRRGSRSIRAPVLPPGGQPLPPGLGRLLGELLAAEPLPRRLVGIDPGQEILAAQLGEGQQQVAEVPLGVDRDHRDAVDRRLFQQRQAQPRLAAAGHAHADGVRGQLLRLVKHRLRADLALRQVVSLAEVEQAELLEIRVLHGHERSLATAQRA